MAIMFSNTPVNVCLHFSNVALFAFLKIQGKDFENCYQKEWFELWNKIIPSERFGSEVKFLHDNGIHCQCHQNDILTWADACHLVQNQIKQGNDDQIHFHPFMKVDSRPHNVANRQKTICFTIHVDDLHVRHPKVKASGYTTIGIQIHNLHSKTKRHQYFLRTSFLPSDKSIWSIDHQLEVLGKELETMRGGIPIPITDQPGKYELLQFVCLGVIADGHGIGKLIGRTGLIGYCGAQLVRENLLISKTYIGNDKEPVFTARRYLTNKVCCLILQSFEMV